MSADPPRWLEDPEVAESLRQDLSAAASSSGPAFDVEAGAARLEAAISIDGGGSSGGAGGAGAAGAGAGVWWAVGGGTLLVLAAIGAWLVARGPEPHQTSPASTVVDSPAQSPVGPAPGAEATPPVLAPVEAVDEDEARPETPLAPPVREPRTRPRREAPQGGANALREEMLLIERARRALPSNPSRALAITEEARRGFPDGMFDEEREGIAVLALLRLGRSGAEARARRYLGAHAQGTMSDQIRAELERP